MKRRAFLKGLGAVVAAIGGGVALVPGFRPKPENIWDELAKEMPRYDPIAKYESICQQLDREWLETANAVIHHKTLPINSFSPGPVCEIYGPTPRG